MFDNILGHERLTNRLTLELNKRYLPASILFVGEESIGKLTCAFELSRLLMCKKNGKWACSCSSCTEHWKLTSHYTLFLGKRDFMPELQSHLELGRRVTDVEEFQHARMLILRTIHKLLSAFNPALVHTSESTVKKLESELDKFKEQLAPLYNIGEESFYQITEDWAQSLLDRAQTIQSKISRTISIEEIRAINQWAWTSGHDTRTVIIDGADKLNTSAANSLLKTLEEPPPGLFFILLAEKRGAVIQTILSRVRIYDFLPRTIEKEQEVLTRIFREVNIQNFSSVKEYLAFYSGIDYNEIDHKIKQLFSYLCGNHPFSQEKIDSLVVIASDTKKFKVFLERLVHIIQNSGKKNAFIPNEIPFPLLEQWNNAIRESYMMHLSFNQNPKSLIEALVFMMKNSIDNFNR